MRKLLIAIAGVVLICLYMTWRSDRSADRCVRSTSPDGRYIAEECMLAYNHGDNPEYVGRV